MEPIRMFIGFDQAEAISWPVFNYSIQRHASRPVQVAPISLSQLGDVIDRPWDPKQSNEFAFSRWLVPYLCEYRGWAIFADCDMLCRDDIVKLWNTRNDRYAVQVVKHEYIPKSETKFLDRPQSTYKHKNWSSIMLMNCDRCRALTPEYVNSAHGLDLHQFKWLKSEHLIGNIHPDWNHLVGEYAPNPNAKIIHWTISGPWFEDSRNVEYADEWYRELQLMTHSDQLPEKKKSA